MATQTKRRPEHDFEAAAERVRDLNEQVVENSKRAGKVYLDLYEKTWHSVADLEEKVGATSPVSWVASSARSQADLTRDLTDAYVSAARELLK